MRMSHHAIYSNNNNKNYIFVLKCVCCSVAISVMFFIYIKENIVISKASWKNVNEIIGIYINVSQAATL